jgi:hypothetical protein
MAETRERIVKKRMWDNISCQSIDETKLEFIGDKRQIILW